MTVMIKINIAIVACLIVTNVCAQTTKLSGTISNSKSEEIKLSHIVETDGKKKSVVLGKATVTNGVFTLNVNIGQLTVVRYNDGNEGTNMVLKPGDDIHMSYHSSYFDETMNYSGSGSKRNNMMANMALIEECEMKKIYDVIYGNEPFDTTEVDLLIEKSQSNLFSYLMDIYKEDADLGIVLKSKLNNNQKNITYYKEYSRKRLAFISFKKEVLGSDMQLFTGKTLDGKMLNIEQYKGKPVYLDFWATWCGPCKAEMPDLLDIEKAYGEKINIVSVGVFCEEEAWQKMATDYGFENNLFIAKGEDNGILKKYMINTIPRYILLDENLKVIDIDAVRPSSGKLKSAFDALLDK